MSLNEFTPADNSAQPERRQHQRREPRELTYIDLGPDNGGLLLNVSEGGLGFDGIAPLRDGQEVLVEFRLPGTSNLIRATCQFARQEDQARGGGLKFVDLTDEARQQIKEWVAAKAGQQQDSPRNAENETAAEAVGGANHGAGSKLKIAPADSLAAVEEQQSALLSPKPIAVSIAPTTTPAPLMPAAPRMDSSKPPNTPAAMNHSQPSLSQAATPKTAMEPHPPIQAGPAISDLTSNRTSRAAGSAHELPTRSAPLNKVQPAANQKKVRNRAPRKVGSQVLQFAAGAAAGCLGMAVIASVLVWAGYLQLPSAVASRTSTEQNATGPSSQDFQVEIVNLNNQRWMLPMVSDNSKEPTEPSAPVEAVQSVTQTQSPKADAPRAAEPAVKAPAPGNRPSPAGLATPRLALQRPLAAATTTSTVSLPETSIFDGITPPLMSPPSVEPRAVPAEPPASALPLPQEAGTSSPAAGLSPAAQTETSSTSAAKAFVPPAPEAAKPGTSISFRPAVLAQRVNPVYPAQAREQMAQGTVQVSATIGKDGIPRNLKVVRGDPRFADAAIAAIARWRYSPAVLNGQPIESELIITINFQL
jgi:TonB family protein